MAFTSNIVSLILASSFFFGQLIRIPIASYNFSLLDITLAFITIINLVYNLIIKKSLPSNKSFLIFVIVAWIIYPIRLIETQFTPISLLYLIRLTFLLSFFIYPPRFINLNLFTLAVIANIIFGLYQYIYWPDFTYFQSQNWDPHLYRLVSTYFDPTFTGLIYLLFLIYAFYNHNLPFRYWLIAISYIALALTYSRSSLLALVITSYYIAYKTGKPHLGHVALTIVIITTLILPRQTGEGTKLERSSSIYAKIQNYQEGITLFNQSPLIGTGYNFLHNHRQPSHTANSHAISGFDSSLLTIATTTGLIGLIPFSLGILYEFYKSSTIGKSLIVATIVHSLFANSLLYAWIVIYLCLLLQSQGNKNQIIYRK